MGFRVNRESQEDPVLPVNLDHRGQPVTGANRDHRVYRGSENQEKTLSKGNQECLEGRGNRALRVYQGARDFPGTVNQGFQDLKVIRDMPVYPDPRAQKEIKVMEVCQGSLVPQVLMEYRGHRV